MDQIQELLTCAICFDTVKLPSKYIPTEVCESHKNHTIFDKVFCNNCLNNYLNSASYQYLKHPQGCDCKLDNYRNIEIIHSSELWSILDILNNDKTFCEFCNINCNTQQTYYRHIYDKLTINDNVTEACPEVIIDCHYCKFKGKRKIVNGIHYDDVHDTKICKLCNKKISNKFFDEHLSSHENYIINKLNEF